MTSEVTGNIRDGLLYFSGQVYSKVTRDIAAHISTQIDPSYTCLVTGSFAFPGRSNLFGYDANTGRGDFYTTEKDGQVMRVAQHHDFPKLCTHVIVGNFASSGYDDLMFYDPVAGSLLTYQVNANGWKQKAGETSTSKTWTNLISGNFGGGGGWTDLFFYDSATGLGEFYTTDGTGALTLLKRYDSLRNGYSQVVMSDFSGGSGPTDLLFYHPETGTADIYVVDNGGEMSQEASLTDWRWTWSLIASGPFAERGGLFLYDLEANEVETFQDIARKAPRPYTQRYSNLPGGWTHAVTGDFDTTTINILLYKARAVEIEPPLAADDGSGRAEVYIFDGSRLTLLNSENGLGPWTNFASGSFGGGVQGQDLYCYNSDSGDGECWRIGDDGSITQISRCILYLPTGCTDLAPGRFTATSNTNLAFYEPAAGKIHLYELEGEGVPNLINSVDGWSTSWKALLSGKLVLGEWDDLMGLDPADGHSVIMTTDGQGGLSIVKTEQASEQGLEGSWTHVVGANLCWDDNIDLFFYDADASAGQTRVRIASGEHGEVRNALRRSEPTTWSLLAPVMIDQANDQHGILYYEAETGSVEIQRVNFDGRFTQIMRREGLPKDWTHITALDTPQGETLLFCYKAPNG